MPTSFGRRRFLAQAGMALAAVETIDHFAACCALAAGLTLRALVPAEPKPRLESLPAEA